MIHAKISDTANYPLVGKQRHEPFADAARKRRWKPSEREGVWARALAAAVGFDISGMALRTLRKLLHCLEAIACLHLRKEGAILRS
jgi:hypothetical protein